MKNILIREIQSNELSWVNTKYDEVGFIHSDATKEVIAVAEVNGERAGLGRLVQISKTEAELGGMFVFESFRKHGIAGKIVEFLLEHADNNQTVYCLPFSHLVNFYEKYGFKICTPEQKLSAPSAVIEKHRWCNKTYQQDTLLLVKNTKTYHSVGL